MELLFIGSIGGGELLILVLLPAILWIWALVDVLKSDFKTDFEKIIWLLLVIFLPFLGWILYVFIGRSQRIKRSY
ncbi:hypothetical protein GU926_02930 [Nibribacter ruber]|uniref:Cardiolipin synthase N-terminal domain-containing protein n=1 Tax=Nibribacter ruber TaxID=2698458 RepID=A0A6P1NXR3_9BACT|nr:PLD nuclease N-terminal domain-containing protein [Nibribacter ruber]QHL86451.1 hypothetical protein GU926_02930 [Nibribacter ruber]